CAACAPALGRRPRPGAGARGGGRVPRGQSGAASVPRPDGPPPAGPSPPPGPGGGADLAPHSPAPAPPLGTTRDYLTAPTIPRDQPGPPPRIVGPLPQLASEIQALLHQRLRLVCLIFVVGWGLIWWHKVFRLPVTPGPSWLIIVSVRAL